MRLTYDKQIDAAYLYLVDISPDQVSKTVPVDPQELDGEINLDFDRDGRLVGIEIQNASRFLSRVLLEDISPFPEGDGEL
jgi:uncharacterized protein YuzE